MVDYFERLGQSFKELYRNPVLLAPFLAQAFLVVLLLLLLLVVSALIALPFGGINPFQDPNLQNIAWTPQFISLLVGLGIIDALILLFVNCWFAGGAYAMLNDVVDSKETGAKTFFKNANRLVWRFYLFTLVRLGIIIVAAIPLATFILLAVFREQGRIAYILLAVLFGVAFLLVCLFLWISLFFGEPAMVRDDLSTTGAMRHSYELLRKQPAHVLLSALLAVGVTFAFVLAVTIPFIPVEMLAKQSQSTALAVLNGFLVVLRVILQILASIVALLFTFEMYKAATKAGKKEKR